MEPGNRIKKNQKYRTRKQKQKAKIREPEAREKGYKQGPMNKKTGTESRIQERLLGTQKPENKIKQFNIFSHF